MVQQHHAEVARLAEPPQHSGQAVELGGAEGAVGAEQRRRLRRTEADDGHRPAEAHEGKGIWSFSRGGPFLAGHEGGPLGERALKSEEHTSELQSLMRISYAVFCLQ